MLSILLYFSCIEKNEKTENLQEISVRHSPKLNEEEEDSTQQSF
jgi:hypothetical protein